MSSVGLKGLYFQINTAHTTKGKVSENKNKIIPSKELNRSVSVYSRPNLKSFSEIHPIKLRNIYDPV